MDLQIIIKDKRLNLERKVRECLTWRKRCINIMSNIKNHIHIVFGYEHYNPLGIIRSLGENAINPVAVVIRGNRKITSKSKYIKKLYFVDSIENGYQLIMEKYGNEREKPFIYTSDDMITNYLDQRYDELKDRFYFYNASIQGRIAYYQDKKNILDLAIKHGLNILKTYVVNVGEIPSDLQYPVITKAIVSTFENWKGDMFICYSEEDLREAYKKIRSQKILLQKYIEKKNELCMEGVSIDKGTKTLISIASQYNYNIADSYSPYMTVQNLTYRSIEEKLMAMFEEIQFEGIFEVEFLIDEDDKLYFLEINFRNSTWSYASTVAGMPLPIIWSSGMLDNKTIDNAYKVIAEPFTAMVEFDDYRKRVKTHQITKVRWLKELRRSRCKYYLGKRDIKPFLSFVFHRIIRGFNRK